jgi:hypothetical protein
LRTDRIGWRPVAAMTEVRRSRASSTLAGSRATCAGSRLRTRGWGAQQSFTRAFARSTGSPSPGSSPSRRSTRRSVSNL